MYFINIFFYNGLCSHKNSLLYFCPASQLLGQVYTAKIPKFSDSFFEDSGNFK